MAGPEKSDGAFRTIREVADWLGVPTHVLRFWESKFDQIAPVKGSGGRRYYRPEDMLLLGGIKVMLHDQGLPIRGVIQRIEADGPEAVMALSPALDTPGSAAAPKTRRVIRRGEDDTLPEMIGARARGADIAPVAPPRIDLVPEPEEPEPGQPGDGEPPDQFGDGTEAPQPADGPAEEPLDGSGQPDVPSTDEEGATAPDTDPEVVSEPDITPEPMPEPAPFPDPAAPAPADDDRKTAGPDVGQDAPAPVPAPPAEDPAASAPAILVRPENQRRLRRVIRKLRGLIAEVEDEIRAAQDAAAGK